MTRPEMEQYREYVSARLSQLSPLMQSYAMGDFSETIEIPEEEDEFSELLVGLSLMVDDVRELIEDQERTINRLEQVQRALRKSEQWLSTTLRSIGDAVIATDAQGMVTFMNRVAEDLTGWDESEAVGQPLEVVFDIINEQTGERVESPVTKVLRENAAVGLANHTVLVAKDGTRRPIDDSGAPIRGEGGTTVGTVLVFRDVTERRRVEEERRLQWERFLTMISNFPEALYVTDTETYEVLFVNKVLEDALESDPVGKLCYQALQGLDAPCEFCTNEIILRDRKPYTWEHHNAVVNTDYLITDQIIKWPDGRDVRFEVAIDITERKQAEEKVREALAELERINADLERFNRLAVGRELRMIELKRQVNALSEELGKAPLYNVSFAEDSAGGG